MHTMKASSLHNPDACTACTVCVAHCPVAEATLAFRGPKFTGPAYERFRLLGFGDEASLEYCSNCKNCDISCPSGVPVSVFNMLARAEYCKTHRPPFRDWMLGHAGLMGRAASFFPAWMLNLGMNNPLTRLALDAMGIDRRAPLPSFAPLNERRALTGRATRSSGLSGPQAAPEKVAAFFPGCFVSYYEPGVGFDLIHILESLGYAVIIPAEFVCCGLPLVAGGFAADALKAAETNSAVLARLRQAGIPVVSACPSCTLMLRQEYAELFPQLERPDTTDATGGTGSGVYEACGFLLSLANAGELPLETLHAAVSPAGGAPMAYHAPCHLRALGRGRTGLELLRRIAGLEVLDMDAACCGISGSYGFKKGKYAVGMDVGAPLFRSMRQSGASLSLSECGTCRVQMRHGADIPVTHPISVLRRFLA